jgi:hypothetical protein
MVDVDENDILLSLLKSNGIELTKPILEFFEFAHGGSSHQPLT